MFYVYTILLSIRSIQPQQRHFPRIDVSPANFQPGFVPYVRDTCEISKKKKKKRKKEKKEKKLHARNVLRGI